MAAFQASVTSSSKNDPASTDLDYYSKPENYTGSNLQALQRFKADKTKEDAANKKTTKKRKVKDAQYHFFHRYKHILKDVIFLDDLVRREFEDDSDSEEDDGFEGEEEDMDEDEDRRAMDDALKPIVEEDYGEYFLRLTSTSTITPCCFCRNLFFFFFFVFFCFFVFFFCFC